VIQKKTYPTAERLERLKEEMRLIRQISSGIAVGKSQPSGLRVQSKRAEPPATRNIMNPKTVNI